MMDEYGAVDIICKPRVDTKRFLEEARITAGLNHQGIVPIHDLGSNDEGDLVYSMKNVKGKDRANLIAWLETVGN